MMGFLVMMVFIIALVKIISHISGRSRPRRGPARRPRPGSGFAGSWGDDHSSRSGWSGADAGLLSHMLHTEAGDRAANDGWGAAGSERSAPDNDGRGGGEIGGWGDAGSSYDSGGSSYDSGGSSYDSGSSSDSGGSSSWSE